MHSASPIYNNILRPYQKESYDQTYTLWERYRSVLLTMPGGGGKTKTSAAIIQNELNKGLTVWFIAHRRELIFNSQKELLNQGIMSGVIMGSIKASPHMKCQVGSIQTVDRRTGLPAPDVIVFDEGHRAKSPSYRRVTALYPQARVLGLTGTPFSSNKKESLGTVYDAQVSTILSSQLIAQGDTVPCSEWLPEGVIGHHFDITNTVDGPEYNTSQLLRAFDQKGIYRSMINAYRQRANFKKTIVFCCNVDHSVKTAQEFCKAGYRFAHIDGETPSVLRDEIIEQYKNGELDGLCNYGILAEGFDVPNTECVIWNTNTASMIKFFQGSWRGSRPWPGKKFYVLIDMGDNIIRFGDPGQDIICDLNEEYVPKGSAGSRPQKRCKNCEKVVPATAKICEHCSSEFVKTFKELEEEQLIQLTTIQKRDIVWKRMNLNLTYTIKTEDLEAFAVVRGFNKKQWDKRGYDKTWLEKEKARRLKGYKDFKLLDYPMSNLVKMQEILQRDYHEKKPIAAEFYQFVSEDENLITFRYLPKK